MMVGKYLFSSSYVISRLFFQTFRKNGLGTREFLPYYLYLYIHVLDLQKNPKQKYNKVSHFREFLIIYNI